MSDRLVVVSNRLPIAVQQRAGQPRVVPGSGGLVTALGPVLRERGGLWLGWVGAPETPALAPLLDEAGEAMGFDLRTVPLTEEDIAGYYHGFANEILWPLFHDLLGQCNFTPSHWPAYVRANRKFARALKEATRPGDFVWIHDYHLLLVAQELRSLRARRQTAFFLHTPFPPLDIFLKLPWRREVLGGLVEYDLIGFQTMRDRRNYLDCARALLPDVRLSGRGKTVTMSVEGRDIRVGAFPISIDFRAFEEKAKSEEAEELWRQLLEEREGRVFVLGVDRLDYSKGIPERIRAFSAMLKRHPELRGEVSFLQVVVPSRTGVAEYRALKHEIDRLVGTINGEHGASGWVPVHYLYRSLRQRDLVAHYRAAHAALVTPLKDGMNLVAKEYCASHVEDDGALVLSEFAGAASQLHRGALLVNPFDVNGVADALYHALTMGGEERTRRMRRLRRTIRDHDIFWWVDRFLAAAP